MNAAATLLGRAAASSMPLFESGEVDLDPGDG
jgi:hypothetical protein